MCHKNRNKNFRILIFNTIIGAQYVNVKKISYLLHIGGPVVKIYSYNGKKNICGDKVHEARCRMRLTQGELAAQLQVAGINIERDSVSRIEIGTRFVADYELRELARILKVNVNWLLGAELE